MRNSLERINPTNLYDELAHDETLRLHVERYRFAGKFIREGTVADVACGTGYGSYLLASEFGEKITRVVGVDNHASSVASARNRFDHAKVEFVLKEAMQFHSSTPLNNVVSLETIEHLQDPLHFILHFANQLTPHGRFIASVPVTPSMDANPYHLHDFTIQEFEKMFEAAGLQKIRSEIQLQPFSPLKIFSGKGIPNSSIRTNLGAYYLKHPSKFWLRIRSTFKDGFVNKYLLVVYEKL